MRSANLNRLIIRSLLISAGIGTLLLVIPLSLYFKYSTEADLIDRVNMTAESASYSLAQGIWNFDDSLISTILLSLQAEEILKITVKDVQGKVLQDIQSKRAIVPTSSDKWNSYPLLYQGKEVGTLEIQITFSKVHLQAMKIGFTLLGLSLLLFVIVGFFAFSGINHNVMQPIASLKEMAKQIEAAHYDITWEAVQTEELNQLGIQMLNMAIQIHKRDEQLQNQNLNLEKLVTERTKELEAQREKTISSGRLAMLGELAAGIAHEINNPLAIIMGSAQLLEMRLKKENAESPQTSANLEKINKMCVRITKIIKGLKCFARDGENDPFDKVVLQEVIQHVLDVAEARMKNLGIQLILEVPSEPLLLLGREAQLTQVFGNLLSNAKDAVESLNEKWIKIEAVERNDSIRVTLSDSGRGIPKEVQEKMFIPFFTTKAVGKGTGMGLSITKGILDQHAAQIEVIDGPHTCIQLTFKKYAAHIPVKAA